MRTLLLLSIALAACADPVAPPPSVLLITLDTVRADRLGAYGHAGRDLTPQLDRLARESVVFTQAFANSSFTPPSHASILTSLYPSEHGLTYWNKKLAQVPTAAEIFTSAGYRTAAFSPLPTLFKLGLERGFQDTASPPYTQEDGEVVLGNGAQVNALALDWLGQQDERPFFAWVHYYDAHRPYGRQGPEWAARFNPFPDAQVGAREKWYQLTPEKRDQLSLTIEQTQYIKDRYDGGIAYLDAQVGALIEGLRRRGQLDSTIVLVTADHGEVLDEHDEEWFSHDPHLYDENVHVPLLLRLPRAASGGLRVGELVSGVDVLPTLLDMAWLSSDAPFSGSSLLPLLSGGSIHRRFVYGDRMSKDGADRRRMLRTETHKLIHDESQGRFRLFELADETRDILPENSNLAGTLQQAYAEQVDALKPAPGDAEAGISPEMEEFLDALGYTGGKK